MNITLKANLIWLICGIFLTGMLAGSADARPDQPAQDHGARFYGEVPAGAEISRDAKKEDDQIELERTAGLRFAVIGDYGNAVIDPTPESDVADLIKSWSPDIIVTTGDNNYDDGEAETIDENIGQFFHEYIGDYQGSYGEGAQINQFFPSLGNHDWRTTDTDNLPYPYLDYFSLPGNERYYEFARGAVHFFIIDSDPHEPDGFVEDSIQAMWLKSRLADSIYPWKLVVMHHPPYSSGERGSASWMQWPYAEWGADVVLAAHDHTYERISAPDGVLYFVNGLGGKSKYDFTGDVEGSQLKYNDDYGAMLVDVSIGSIRFRFINRQAEVIDDFTLVKPFSYSYLPLLQRTFP